MATLIQELSSKRLELLKAAVPSISRVAVLMDPSVTYLLPELKRAAQSWGVTLQPLPIFDGQASPEFDQAFAIMTQARADAHCAARIPDHVAAPPACDPSRPGTGCRRCTPSGTMWMLAALWPMGRAWQTWHGAWRAMWTKS